MHTHTHTSRLKSSHWVSPSLNGSHSYSRPIKDRAFNTEHCSSLIGLLRDGQAWEFTTQTHHTYPSTCCVRCCVSVFTMLLQILSLWDPPGQEVFVMEADGWRVFERSSLWCVLCSWGRVCLRSDVCTEVTYGFLPGLMPPLFDVLRQITSTQQNSNIH